MDKGTEAQRSLRCLSWGVAELGLESRLEPAASDLLLSKHFLHIKVIVLYQLGLKLAFLGLGASAKTSLSSEIIPAVFSFSFALRMPMPTGRGILVPGRVVVRAEGVT